MKKSYIYSVGILVFFLLGLGFWQFGPVSSTPAGEDLLQTIEDARSRIRVGINYIDYQRLAQDIQVKLDRFERDSATERLSYGANLWNVATTFIYAAKQDENVSYYDKPEWNPQPHWSNAEKIYRKMQACRKTNNGCFKLSQKLILMSKDLEETTKLMDEFKKSNSK
jgi:hypothetical protein